MPAWHVFCCKTSKVWQKVDIEWCCWKFCCEGRWFTRVCNAPEATFRGFDGAQQMGQPLSPFFHFLPSLCHCCQCCTVSSIPLDFLVPIQSTALKLITSQLSLAEQAACSFPGPKVDGVCCFSLSCHGPDFLEGTNWSCIVHLRSDPGISMPLKWTLDTAQRCLASGYQADVMFAYDCDFRNSCRCTRVLHRLCYLKTFNVCLRDWPEPQTDTNCYIKAMDGLGLVTTSSEPPLLKCIRAGCDVWRRLDFVLLSPTRLSKVQHLSLPLAMARPQLLSACIHVMQAQETANDLLKSSQQTPVNCCELVWIWSAGVLYGAVQAVSLSEFDDVLPSLMPCHCLGFVFAIRIPYLVVRQLCTWRCYLWCCWCCCFSFSFQPRTCFVRPGDLLELNSRLAD